MDTLVKVTWLQQSFVPAIAAISPNTPAHWGKMSLHQMVEHMSDSIRIANGKDPQDCITPEEHLPRMRAFMLSDKPFKENTPNSQLSDTPPEPRYEDIKDSLGELQQEINDFIDVFEQDKHKIITNPFFGDMDFEHWVALLYKHAVHHLRQFGVLQPLS